MLTRRCIQCDEPFEAKPTGRPRLYCSNRCRLKAQRERKSDRALGVMLGAGGRVDLGEIEISDVLGPRASDPDEAVVESIVLARSAAAAFGVSAAHARPQLAWRCTRMADHIAAGLERYFKPR